MTKLAAAFRDSDGDLRHVAKALVEAPEAWEEARPKLKRPGEWVVGMVRAAGVRADGLRFGRGQLRLFPALKVQFQSPRLRAPARLPP